MEYGLRNLWLLVRRIFCFGSDRLAEVVIYGIAVSPHRATRLLKKRPYDFHEQAAARPREPPQIVCIWFE